MRKSRAFTLIELLVVISIIALLLAILMPALSRVKELGIVIVCSNHLKTIGIANTTYASMNNNYYLPISNPNSGYVTDWWPSNEAFRKCLEMDSYKSREEEDINKGGGFDLPDEFLCPADRISQNRDDFGTGNVSLSYGYNSTDWGIWSGSGSNARVYAGHRADSLKRPGEKLAFIDAIDWWVAWGRSADYRKGWDKLNQAPIWAYVTYQQVYGPVIYRHREGACVLFYDGHVLRMDKDEIFVVEDWEANPKRAGMWTASGRYPP